MSASRLVEMATLPTPMKVPSDFGCGLYSAIRISHTTASRVVVSYPCRSQLPMMLRCIFAHPVSMHIIPCLSLFLRRSGHCPMAGRSPAHWSNKFLCNARIVVACLPFCPRRPRTERPRPSRRFHAARPAGREPAAGVAALPRPAAALPAGAGSTAVPRSAARAGGCCMPLR